MAVIQQKHRPIGLVVFDADIFSLGGLAIPWFTLLYPRPEDMQYTYPSRGTVIQTFDGGVVDDFGQGLADIIITGNTGWNGALLPGELLFYNLRDMIVFRFHDLRQAKANLGMPIDTVKMYLVDTLSTQVWEVYPQSFTARKNRTRPLLYQYTMRLTGLNLVFGPSLISKILGGLF